MGVNFYERGDGGIVAVADDDSAAMRIDPPEVEDEPHRARFLFGGDMDDSYEGESLAEIKEIAADEITYRQENPPRYEPESSGGGGGWIVLLGLLGLGGLGLWEYSQRQGRDAQRAAEWLRARAQQPQLMPPASQPFGTGR